MNLTFDQPFLKLLLTLMVVISILLSCFSPYFEIENSGFSELKKLLEFHKDFPQLFCGVSQYHNLVIHRLNYDNRCYTIAKQQLQSYNVICVEEAMGIKSAKPLKAWQCSMNMWNTWEMHPVPRVIHIATRTT